MSDVITELTNFTHNVKSAFEVKLNDNLQLFHSESIKTLVYNEYKNDLLDIYYHLDKVKSILEDRILD